jgi:hypothetical protein
MAHTIFYSNLLFQLFFMPILQQISYAKDGVCDNQGGQEEFILHYFLFILQQIA